MIHAMKIRYRWPDIAAFLATCIIAFTFPIVFLTMI